MSRRTLTTILAAGAALAFAAPAEATYPGDNGRIAYENFQTGQIESINPDGTDRQKLTPVRRRSFAAGPSWSADGQHILFEKHTPDRSGDVTKIWMMDPDGDHPEKIAGHGNFRYYNPQFNPAGTRIVFSRCQPGDGVCAIWDMAADGSDQRALTPYVHDSTNEAVDFHPTYSPDGNTIVFDRFFSDGESARLFSMDADGDDEQPLTSPALEAFGADYSPDGETIAFATKAPRTGSNVWTMEADGDNPAPLTADSYPANNIFPSYSPEGDQVVFSSDRRFSDLCCLDLFLVPSTGGAGTRIHGIRPPGAVNAAWGSAIP